MKTQITLSAADIKLVKDFMKHTGALSVTVIRDDSSGIGYTLDVQTTKTVGMYTGTFRARVVDEKDW